MCRIFIVEGIDGSGKTSICRKLKDYISKTKYCYIVREPGGTTCSEYIRSIIKDPNVQMSKEHQLTLFVLARCFVTNYINNQYILEDADFILDRYIPSTVAYQHYGLGISMDLISKLHDDITPCSWTTMNESTIIYLKTDPKIALQRIRSRGDEPDKFEKLDFLQKVSDGYDQYFKTNPAKKIITIDTSDKTEENVWNELLKELAI